jgi:hypothetical protein
MEIIRNSLMEIISNCLMEDHYGLNFWRDDNDICFVLDQHTEFDFYSTNSLKQQSAGNYRNDAPLKTY